MARKFDRTLVLEILFCIKDIIDENIITASTFRDSVFKVSQINSKFTKQLEVMDWQKVRTIVRGMHNKYHKEDNHQQYNAFVNLAREHFRNVLI